jgi:hypothetical protein
MRALITFGLGALAMYLLDPKQGRGRRALIRDQLTRARGATMEARRAVRTEPEPGPPLQAPEGARHLGR